MTETLCNTCKYCVLEDYGYSNYTVEGTYQDCLLNLNPGFPVDHWYGKTEENKGAVDCRRYVQGEPIELDVDRDYGYPEGYSDDQEIIELLIEYDDS